MANGPLLALALGLSMTARVKRGSLATEGLQRSKVTGGSFGWRLKQRFEFNIPETEPFVICLHLLARPSNFPK